MFTIARFKQLLLLFGDFLLLLASLYITLIIRYSQTYVYGHWQEHFYPFLIIYLIWVMIFYSQNLYNLNLTKNNLPFFRVLFESFILNIFIATFFFYFTPFFGIAPKTNLFINIFIANILLILWRSAFNLFTGKYLSKNKIAFLGYSKEVQELLIAFRKEPQLGYEAIVLITNSTIPNLNIKQISIDNFIKNAHELNINTIAINHAGQYDKTINNKLYQLLFSNITFVNLLDFFEQVSGKVPVETVTEGWFLDNLQESEKNIYDKIKIVIDYFLAIIMSIIFLIMLIPVSLITLITSGRPIFYSQERIGKNGKKFKIIKFRTMIQNAETNGARFAEAKDERITSFGRFLRSTRIDELPQILNVLKGDMSFIGPRPERPEFVEKLIEAMPFYPIRHLVKPGLTGWAQINYPYAGSIEENLKKLQYDIYYIKNRSVIIDVAIVLKTFNIILHFKGR